MILEFTVFGISQPMGSKTAFLPKGSRYPVITDSNRNLRQWQTLVADQAARTIDDGPVGAWQLLLGGVALALTFYLPRPKSHGTREIAHVTKPDLDKLIRAVGDALVGIAYADDRQIVEVLARKRYAALGEVPHAVIRVAACAGVDLLPLEKGA